jgi:signal transduction histidine kinase
MPYVGWLRELFQTNQIIVLTIYGEVFFVMGLAIALQSRRRSALALAGPLPWLAAFAFVHGFVEWGYLFIPLQSSYLPGPVVEALLVAQLILKAASFALLLQFGAELLLAAERAGPMGTAPEHEPGSRRLPALPWLRVVPSLALGLWAVGTVAVSATAAAHFAIDTSPWLDVTGIGDSLRAVGTPLAVGDVMARYMLAIPGAVAAMVGLTRNAAALGPALRPPVGTSLRLAVVALGAYGVVGGAIGMPVPFLPGSVVNSSSILSTLGVPVEVLRSLAGLAIAIAVIRMRELFEQETDRALADARRRETLLRERERIGRDLHDGIIQSIYAVGLHLEEAQASLTADAAAAADAAGIGGARTDEEPAEGGTGRVTGPRGRLRIAMGELNRIVVDLRAYIFDLRSASLESLDPQEIVSSVADELRANTLVSVELTVTGDPGPPLTPEQAEQLRQIVHEAFSNVLRHARARHVWVALGFAGRALTLEIRDDGVGYDPEHAARRNRPGATQGLDNLRRRAEILGATLQLEGLPGRGAAVSLTMPLGAARRGR